MANTTNRTTRIKHVFGNVLKLAIPLTLRTVTLEGGIVEVTDTDYTPSNHYPVVVQFVNGPLKYELDATIRDNYIAVVEDKGTIPVGNYAIVVLCKDDNGDPRRFKQRCVLEVVDVTADAGIEVGIEFEAQEWLLDGAIFLAIKGEDGIDGVGIESITTDETSVSGEYNQVTFHLTNGSSYTLNVRNGESTEQTLPANVVVDENYVHTDNNYTNTDKQKVESVDKLFADAEYDRISRRLNFFKHGDTMHTNPLKSIDITDFVRDSRVSSFRIIDDNLTIKLNSDGNNEEFKVPISSIVNLSNYYTKSQVNTLVSGKANIDQRTGELTASQATRVVLDYIVGVYDGEDEPAHEVEAGNVWYDNGQIYHSYTSEVEVEIESLGEPQSSIVYCNAENNKTYRWTGSEFVQVGGSGSGSGGYEPPVGGIPKSDLASGVQTSLGKADTALQPNDLEGYATTDDVDDAISGLVDGAPLALDTLKELADALGDNDDAVAALTTSLDGKVDKESGKSLMTDAERTKLQGIAAGAEVNVQPNWTQTNTSADDYIKNKPTLATVATSGSYDDLQDKPTIPAAQVNSDWNASTGKAAILNKPTIPVGIANTTTSGDGTWTMMLSNGEYITIDLNHEHPQYVESDDLADVATTGSYNDLQDKPTIPSGVIVDQTITQNGTNPVQGGAIYTALQGKANKNGDVGENFNASHVSIFDYNTRESIDFQALYENNAIEVRIQENIEGGSLRYQFDDSGDVKLIATIDNIPTKTSELTNDSGFTSNAGTITGITMNGVSKGTSGVVDLGTVITAHQDISGKANTSEMAVSTSGDQTTITLKTGTSATVINQHQSLSGYAKYVLLADEAAYEALATKDSGTLYLIPES